MSEKEKAIRNYMENLQISREEAEQLWEDDQEDYIGEEGEEMTAKAKKIKRYEQTDKPKTKTAKPKKLDDEKVALITFLAAALEQGGYNPTIANAQKEITFGEYSVTLTKHRPPKK